MYGYVNIKFTYYMCRKQGWVMTKFEEQNVFGFRVTTIKLVEEYLLHTWQIGLSTVQ